MINCLEYKDIDIIKQIQDWDLDSFYCIIEKYKEKLLKYIIKK